MATHLAESLRERGLPDTESNLWQLCCSAASEEIPKGGRYNLKQFAVTALQSSETLGKHRRPDDPHRANYRAAVDTS